MQNELLTIKEAGARLKLSRSTITRMITEGALPAVRLRSGKRKHVYRVPSHRLEQWLNKNAVHKNGTLLGYLKP